MIQNNLKPVFVDINPKNSCVPAIVNDYQQVLHSAEWTYNHLLEMGISPEQARMVLPQSLYTEWYWSGTLYAFARICNLRCKPDAQKETQNVAWEIDKFARKLFPASWHALRNG